jgi:PPM family protein phosphatase
MATLRWGAATHEGQLRTQNEDNHHAGDGLFVVADGMGGHLAGEVASEMAVARLDQRLPVGRLGTRDDLVAAINEANVEIYNASISNPDQSGMGTTITAIAVVEDPIDGEVLAVANVGDSRGYVLRHNRLRQVTVDHSFVQELVAEGAITASEARHHPRRNIVTRALGIEPYVRVDTWAMPIIRGDRFLLCSDGLVDEVADEVIQEILATHRDDPAAAAQALVDAANASGGRDNITAVVVDVLEGDDPPDPTEEFDVIPVWSDEQGQTTDGGPAEIVSDPLDDDADRQLVPAGAAIALDGEADGGGATALATETATEGATAPAETTKPAKPRRRRTGRLGRMLLALGAAAVLVLGFAILAAWARSGYFVAYDDDGTVAIYQGRQGGFWWFEPTREAKSNLTREQLDAESNALVAQELNFESRADAERFIAISLAVTTTTSTTTPTTTTVPIAAPPTIAPTTIPGPVVATPSTPTTGA